MSLVFMRLDHFQISPQTVSRGKPASRTTPSTTPMITRCISCFSSLCRRNTVSIGRFEYRPPMEGAVCLDGVPPLLATELPLPQPIKDHRGHQQHMEQ